MDSARSLHLPAGTAARGPYAVDIDPERAGWTHSALRVLDLPPGGTHRFETGISEWVVLPLSGGGTVRVDGEILELVGRASVFDGVSDFAYVPRGAHVEIASGAGGRFALAGAKCERRLPARYGPAPEVPVETRGSGNRAREVRNFAAAGAFDCDRLIAVEVVTPGGNWSSYPPHKHDEHRPGEESVLEEIYYYEVAEAPGQAPGPAPGQAPGPTPGQDASRAPGRPPGRAYGYQRITPSRPGGAELLAEVRAGDAVLVPDGWHGPSIAQPGHPLYYLNVMAGPGPEREWKICFHPDHTEGYA
ncbi:5-deoxy-glucuronate isomerase [Streptomyces showdoensis]|uniref:IolB protein n=1 Tax=Streptomyces showdoensis TaxID=68268 RepID=A0A2P2GRF5_STREW|nr:5-deoxy-glucuronate isomerase [Streptomyces showdoensis]KKZ74074.1 IolB protein [Streptomyces showdoensis]